jgi:hypothetical protein
VADNSGTMLCVPAEDSQSVEVSEQQNFFQEVKTLPALEDFVRRTARDVGHRVDIQQHPLDPDESGIISELLYIHPRWVFSTHVLEA